MKSRVLLVGGGHTHALLLAKMKQKPFLNTEIWLVDTNEKVPYTGLLPGFTAGHYDREDLYINLKILAAQAGVKFVKATVTGLDNAQKKVHLDNGDTQSYDLISFDIGIHARDFRVQGLVENSVPVKPLSVFATAWQNFLAQEKSEPRLVIIGGGVAAVEMALAMEYSCRNQSPKITIVTRGEILGNLSSAVRTFLKQELSRKNIKIETGQTVSQVDRESVVLKTGQRLESDFVLAAVGPRPYKWLEETNLELKNGYIRVNKHLQSVSQPSVFAVGDCAHFEDYPLPKAGVYAVREAPILYKNIELKLANKNLSTYKPQKHYLKLITLGEKRACADKFGICIHGSWVWKLKNKIDTDFMGLFSK